MSARSLPSYRSSLLHFYLLRPSEKESLWADRTYERSKFLEVSEIIHHFIKRVSTICRTSITYYSFFVLSFQGPLTSPQAVGLVDEATGGEQEKRIDILLYKKNGETERRLFTPEVAFSLER